MNLRIPRSERIDLLTHLGQHLVSEDELLQAVMQRTYHHNNWFTLDNQRRALQGISREYLDPAKLAHWLQAYDLPEPQAPQTIGLVMAGNIPLVGFHDWLSVFAAGHRAQIKLSDKDQFLFPYLMKWLRQQDERVGQYVDFVPQLKGFDAVIATGSNNASRYFDAYFSRYPHIIRRNRNAVAVLDGTESREELVALGEDVFAYFGLGCRNVAKLYVPEGYDFTPLLEALHEYRNLILHQKYKNNFDYNYAIYVMNKVDYLANGCVLLTENKAIPSHIAGLYYEYYSDPRAVAEELTNRALEIQCVVAHEPVADLPTFPFGQAQRPALTDYADGIDTLAFLRKLNEKEPTR